MENAFAVLWLQIIATQWTNICLVNISSMNYFLLIVMPFEFHRMRFLMSKSHPHMYYSSNVRGAACRASCWPQDLRQTPFNQNNILLYKSNRGSFLQVIPLSLFHFYICPFILHLPLLSWEEKRPQNGLTWIVFWGSYTDFCLETERMINLVLMNTHSDWNMFKKWKETVVLNSTQCFSCWL